MVARDVEGDAESAPTVTPLSEIRRHKGMRLEEYVELYPAWADWMRNSDQLMYDAEGGAWVARWDPELGVPIGGEDDEGYTPEVAEALARESERAMEEVKAGRYYTLDDLDAEDGIAE